MRAKTLAALLLVGVLAAGLIPGMAAAKGKKSGPVTVGTDDAGDWGCNQDCGLAPIGDGLGMDLTAATISMADAKTVNFVISVNSLPPSGGIPEIARYTWDMTVNGDFVELDGKFTNYSRGACDPTAGCGSGYQPRDPGMSPFLVRGNCAANAANVTICEDLAIIQATFDAAAGTITIPVPLETINAKAGSKIAPGTNIFGGSISAAPAAFVTSNNFPMDMLTATGTFVVPKK
jgi:hypothetical protein